MNLQTTLNLKELKSLNDNCILDLINNLRIKLSSNDDEVLRSLSVELEHIKQFKTEIEDFACASDAYFKFQEAYEEKEKFRKELVRTNEKIRNMELEHNVRVAELKALKISAETQLEETKQELKKSKSKLVNMYKRPLSSNNLNNNNNNTTSEINLPEKPKPQSFLVNQNQKPRYDLDDDSFSLFDSNLDSIFESNFTIKKETPRPQNSYQTPENSFRIEETLSSTPRKKSEQRLEMNIQTELSNILAFSKKIHPNLNITQKLEELFNEVANNHEQTYLLKPTDRLDIKDFTFNSSTKSNESNDQSNLDYQFENKSVQTNEPDHEDSQKVEIVKMVNEIEAQFVGRLSIHENEMSIRTKDYEEKIQHLNEEFTTAEREKNLLQDEVNYLKNKIKSLESFLDEQVHERDRERIQLNKYEDEIINLKSKNRELNARCDDLTKFNKSLDYSSSFENPTTLKGAPLTISPNENSMTTKLMHQELTDVNRLSLPMMTDNSVMVTSDSQKSINNSSVISNDVEKYPKHSLNPLEVDKSISHTKSERSITPDSLTDGRIEDMESDDQDDIAEGAITSDSDESFDSNNNVNVDDCAEPRNNTTTFSLKQANILKIRNQQSMIQMSPDEMAAYNEEMNALKEQNKFLYNEIMKMNKEHMDLQKDFDEVQILLDRESNRVEQLLNEAQENRWKKTKQEIRFKLAKKKRPDVIEERDEDLFMLNEEKQSLEAQLASVQDELASYKVRFSHNTATTTTCSTDSGLITVENNSKQKFSEDPDSPQNSVKSPDVLDQMNQTVVTTTVPPHRQLTEIIVPDKFVARHELNIANEEIKSLRLHCEVEKNRANSLAVEANLAKQKCQELTEVLSGQQMQLEKLSHENEYLRRRLEEEAPDKSFEKANHQEVQTTLQNPSPALLLPLGGTPSFGSLGGPIEKLQESFSNYIAKSKMFEDAQKSIKLAISEVIISSLNQQLTTNDCINQNISSDISITPHCSLNNGPSFDTKMTMTDSTINTNLSIREERYYDAIIRLNKLITKNKSLVYQKKFLIWQIGNFRGDESSILYRISLPDPPKKSFRVVAFTIIALFRIKILQRRWKNRNVNSLSLRNVNNSLNFNNSLLGNTSMISTKSRSSLSVDTKHTSRNDTMKKITNTTSPQKSTGRLSESRTLSTSQRYQSYRNPRNSVPNRLLTPTASSSAKVNHIPSKTVKSPTKRLSQASNQNQMNGHRH